MERWLKKELIKELINITHHRINTITLVKETSEIIKDMVNNRKLQNNTKEKLISTK